MTTSLLELYCEVDDFWQAFEPVWEAHLIGEEVRKCPEVKTGFEGLLVRIRADILQDVRFLLCLL